MQINNLTKYYADRLVFAEVTAVVGPGDHVGLVGANGVGKPHCSESWPVRYSPIMVRS